MPLLLSDCELFTLSEAELICDFECDNADLNDFFCNDAINYQKQLLGQTYYFRQKDTSEIVCAFTLSNDSIKVESFSNNVKRRVRHQIPHAKTMNSYPATLIGRFGVPLKYEGNGIGSQVMDFIKSICLTEDTNKCRFLLVDSYNTEKAKRFYEKNGFNYLFPDESKEMEHFKRAILKTRFMFFDLITWADTLKTHEDEIQGS